MGIIIYLQKRRINIIPRKDYKFLDNGGILSTVWLGKIITGKFFPLASEEHQHKKVYAPDEINIVFQRAWVCSSCGERGYDNLDKIEEKNEYLTLLNKPRVRGA